MNSTTRQGFDAFGNPLNTALELGRVDDDHLHSEKILLYVGYTQEVYEWHHAQEAVAERNIHMDIVKAPSQGRCSLSQNQLSDYSQLWYVSDRTPTLDAQQVGMIERYVKDGNGLLIWADNDPYFADANLIAKKTIGTRFSGNLQGDAVLTLGEQLRPGRFIEHPLTQGINKLYEGITISTIAPARDLTILAQSHDGQLCMACFERDQQRIVLDTGFTKLKQGAFHKTAGTARYFRNIAFWLAKATRGFQYTLFTPGRDRIATINSSESSERYKYTLIKPTTLSYVLQWEGTASLGLVVQDPHGHTIQDIVSAKSPIRVDVPAKLIGDWVCWVNGVQVPHANFPYVLTLVQTTIHTPNSSRPALKPLSSRGTFTGNIQTTYTKQWSSTHPGCLIILIDQSGSMDEQFGGHQLGAGKRKCDMVATVLNNLLHEFVKTNTVGHEIKPRADIAVLSYEGNTVHSALGGTLATHPFVNLPELMTNPLRIDIRAKKEVDEDTGAIVEVPIHFPIWVEPMIGTTTPMCEAIRRAGELAEQWAITHMESYPPVVINITDGASTDGDPTPIAHELCQIWTNYGSALLFNCHITNLPDPKVEFPSSEHEIPHDPEKLARLLFSLSSFIPAAARNSIQQSTGQPIEAEARGFIFNGDATAVRQMFIFATLGATQIVIDPNR